MSRQYRKLILLATGICCLFAVGFLLEQLSFFAPIKKALQSSAVPTSILDYGAMGKVMKRIGLLEAVGNDSSRFPETEPQPDDFGEITFQKKRQVGQVLYGPRPREKDLIDVNGVLEIQQFKERWPVLSIQIDERELYDPEVGLLSHPEMHGKDWERQGLISFWENGQVKFKSPVGIRVHGGRRRITKSYNSFRFYFREEYGSAALYSNDLFENSSEQVPLRTVILHTTDWPPGYPVNNPLAYDISRKIGCVAPETRLVEIYINGKSLGMGFMTEHLSKRQWQARSGAEDFYFYKFRGKFSRADEKMYEKYFWSVIDDPQTLSMEKISSIDMDNFSRHLFSWAYTGVTDYCQGVAVLEDSPAAKLYWINWDMDHGFYDYTAISRNIERANWRQEGIPLIYRNNHDCGRTKLFSRLMNEVPEYRRYFIDLATLIMNHNLTYDFLSERVSYYEEMLKSFGSPHDQYIAMLEDYMENRSTFIRSEIADFFKLDGPYRCQLTLPAGIQVLVDGQLEENGYIGWYFAGQTVEVRLEEENRYGFSYWLVNGKKIKQHELSVSVSENIAIEPVFLEGN